MTLQEKVQTLKTDADIAARLAAFWEKQIAEHGELKAEAFYKTVCSNGNGNGNHAIRLKLRGAAMFGNAVARACVKGKATAGNSFKSVEWEGLALSREPTETEKLCVKVIAGAQEAGKASVTTILLKLRLALIDDALKAIKKLTPATYHELILKTPKESKVELREQLTKIFNKGRRLVAAELSKTKQDEDDDDEDAEELDDWTDLTDSRVVNEVQSRITASAARYALLGLAGAAIIDAVRKEMADGSVSYIDRAATGVSNKVLSFGRSREADDRSDEWERVEYSAILDSNVCDSCASDDGTTATDEADLQPAPSPDCAGFDNCRCFHVWVAAGG